MKNDNETDVKSHTGHVAKKLSREDEEKLLAQNSRIVSKFKALQLERDAKKHWDLFYKRNESKFFKDRHWTTREFKELLGYGDRGIEVRKILLEVGCGVGNFVYPLLQEKTTFETIYACDLSPRAIEFVKGHKLYDEKKVVAFQADVTEENCFSCLEHSVDIATLIFVLSTIHPEKLKKVLDNIYNVLNPNGLVLLRDYGRHDMAQLRFKAGHKISENFYMRQDGTRSYYFSVEEVQDLFQSCGFKTLDCYYVERRTVNVKEGVDVPRIFVQARFSKT